MTCSKIQVLLSAYIDDELDKKNRQEVRHHLAFCSECQQEYQELLQTKELLNKLEDIDLPIDFQLSFEEGKNLKVKNSFWFRKKILLPTAASFCLILIGGFIYFSSNSRNDGVSFNYLVSEHLIYSREQPLADDGSLSLALGKQHGKLLESPLLPE